MLERFDLDSVDEWAVRLVVNEGVFIRLNETEKIIAAVCLRDMGVKAPEISDRLHVDLKEVEALLKRWQRVGRKIAQEKGFNLLQCQRTDAVR